MQTLDILTMNSQADSGEYILGIGDRVAVKFFYNDKLNDEVVIRPDGKISLQLIGDITAAGLAPSQLSAVLTQEYSKVLKSSSETYVLSVGDRIAVKFFYNDKLNDEVVIRPDGKISLQLIGDVTAAGLAPSQLNAVLRTEYSKIIESPDVTVIVKDFKTPDLIVIVKDSVSQKIYVGGEVTKPSLLNIQGKLRILDAIIQAGGALNTAELKNIILIRYKGSQEPNIYSLDLNKIIRGEIPDISLRPYDIVYLPKTAIAQVELFVKQYLYNLLPNQVLFTFPYNLNPSVRVEQK